MSRAPVTQYSQVQNNVIVPAGHLMVSHSWQNTQLATLLANNTSILYSNGLGAIDFRASNDKSVLFVSEADLIAGLSSKRRIAKFKKSCLSQQGIVIVENTPMTTHLFPNLQKFIVVDLNLSIIPVRNIEEAAKLLTQMVNCETKVGVNPFLKRDKTANSPDMSILNAVLKIPGLGQKRALQLIDHYGSLFAVANASEEDLGQIVGNTTGIAIYNFFHTAT